MPTIELLPRYPILNTPTAVEHLDTCEVDCILRVGMEDYDAHYVDDKTYETCSSSGVSSLSPISRHKMRRKSRKERRFFIYVLATLASVGGMLFGYDTGVISGAIIQLRSDDKKWKDVGGFDLNDFEQEMVVGVATGGAILGSILSTCSNNRFGRRGTILGASVLFIVGALVMGLSPTFWVLLVGRFIVGLSVGFASHTVPIYIAEVSPSDVRGRLVTLNNCSIVIGQVLASVVDCGFGLGNVTQGWRYMLALGGVPGIALLVGFIYLPESPRWLIMHDLKREAQQSLQLIRDATTFEGVGKEFQRIESHISENLSDSKDHTISLNLLRRNAPQLFLGCGLQLLQQLCGINTLMYYSSSILSSASGTDEDSDPWSSKNNESICLSAVTAFAQFVGVVIGLYLVDRVGRRPLTLGSLLAVTISLVAIGFAFFGQKSQTLALCGMIAYLISFGIGMSPIPWLINAEIYPIEIRAFAISLSTGVNWTANLIVSSTFLTLAEATSTSTTDRKNHPDVAFFIYASISALGFAWVYAALPETKGRDLEEITRLFRTRHVGITSEGEYENLSTPDALGPRYDSIAHAEGKGNRADGGDAGAPLVSQ